ncbi:hypothetical protein Hanom_Chr05g00422571 [Helianthus anomalus]
MVACPAVACTGDYAFAASAWIEALPKDLEPTLQKAGGLACTGWRHCIVGRPMVVVAPRLMVVRSSLGQLALHTVLDLRYTDAISNRLLCKHYVQNKNEETKFRNIITAVVYIHQHISNKRYLSSQNKYLSKHIS